VVGEAAGVALGSARAVPRNVAVAAAVVARVGAAVRRRPVAARAAFSFSFPEAFALALTPGVAQKQRTRGE
jgi:hypothetical protein